MIDSCLGYGYEDVANGDSMRTFSGMEPHLRIDYILSSSMFREKWETNGYKVIQLADIKNNSDHYPICVHIESVY